MSSFRGEALTICTRGPTIPKSTWWSIYVGTMLRCQCNGLPCWGGKPMCHIFLFLWWVLWTLRSDASETSGQLSLSEECTDLSSFFCSKSFATQVRDLPSQLAGESSHEPGAWVAVCIYRGFLYVLVSQCIYIPDDSTASFGAVARYDIL